MSTTLVEQVLYADQLTTLAIESGYGIGSSRLRIRKRFCFGGASWHAWTRASPSDVASGCLLTHQWRQDTH